MRAETNALSAHLSHVSYREPWLRDVEGIKEWITVRRRGRENVSEAFQRPLLPRYLSFSLYVCLPIRYFYQSAVGSWNTEASLFASANQMLRGGGQEGGRRKHLRAEKNQEGKEDETRQQWWVRRERVREQNLHPWYIWHLKWGFRQHWHTHYLEYISMHCSHISFATSVSSWNSSEPRPSLRASVCPHRYVLWSYRTFAVDGGGFPVQISLLGQVSVCIIWTIECGKGCRITVADKLQFLSVYRCIQDKNSLSSLPPSFFMVVATLVAWPQGWQCLFVHHGPDWMCVRVLLELSEKRLPEWEDSLWSQKAMKDGKWWYTGCRVDIMWRRMKVKIGLAIGNLLVMYCIFVVWFPLLFRFIQKCVVQTLSDEIHVDIVF